MKKSAGILAYRKNNKTVEVLLVHPGGPFFKNKDLGAWSIPKGEFEDEDPLRAAKREFLEETGLIAEGDFIQLTAVRLKSGKTIVAWAVEQDLDLGSFKSNTFFMEWPPKSGKQKEFPEVDRAEWFPHQEAILRINPAQAAFVEELLTILP